MALTSEMRSRVAVGLALVLVILGSVALFALIQTALPYVALIRGQFYSPAPNSSQTALDRAFSRTGFVMLRLAFWPAVLFVLLEISAAYSLSKLVHLEARFPTVRRLLAASGLSLLTTVVLLVPVWWLLMGLVIRASD